MQNSAVFILAHHCHIPPFVDEAEYEAAYDQRLKPFLSSLYRYPRVPAVLHYSGPLLYWIERRHPELFDIIREMLKRKQVELLSGGFYEPAMQFISQRDKMGQIELLSTYLKKHFGKKAHGAYIPRKCWDNTLPNVFKNCALSYTFMPEDFFKSAGIDTDKHSFPVLIENQGDIITVFPVKNFAQYGEHYKSPSSFLHDVINPDGKEGVWTIFPERFSGNECDTQSDICAFLEKCKPLDGNVVWTLPSVLMSQQFFSNQKTALKKRAFPCGQSKNFLYENEAQGALYSRMLFTRNIVEKIQGDKERKKSALHEVYKAQCYDLYHHDDALHHSLRSSAFESLLAAENIAFYKKKQQEAIHKFDFDFDGAHEYVFRGNKLSCFVHRKGAAVFELDYMSAAWNYVDLSGGASFQDALLSEDYFLANPPGKGGFLSIDGGKARALYEEWWDEKDTHAAKLQLNLAPPAIEGGAFSAVGVDKSYKLRKDAFNVDYALSNTGDAEERFVFCTRLALSLPVDREKCRVLIVRGEERIPSNETGLESIDGIVFQDLQRETVITLKGAKPFNAYISDTAPFTLVLSTTVSLAPNAKYTQSFSLTFSH